MPSPLTASPVTPSTLSETHDVGAGPYHALFPPVYPSASTFPGVTDSGGLLVAAAASVVAGNYPGSSTFPGSTDFPGRGTNLAAQAA